MVILILHGPPFQPRIQIRQDIRFWESEANPHEVFSPEKLGGNGVFFFEQTMDGWEKNQGFCWATIGAKGGM